MNQPQHHQTSKNPVSQHSGEGCSLEGEVTFRAHLCTPSWCWGGRSCWCRGQAAEILGFRTYREGYRTQGARECLNIPVNTRTYGADWGAQVRHLPCCSSGAPGPWAPERPRCSSTPSRWCHQSRRPSAEIKAAGELCSFWNLDFTITQALTSFSQLELRVSRALGLLGALLPGPGGMPCSGGWLGHWLTVLPPRLVDKYCRTCCLWACWMWYLDGVSKWGCTYRSRTSALHYCCIWKHLEDLDLGTFPQIVGQ